MNYLFSELFLVLSLIAGQFCNTLLHNSEQQSTSLVYSSNAGHNETNFDFEQLMPLRLRRKRKDKVNFKNFIHIGMLPSYHILT